MAADRSSPGTQRRDLELQRTAPRSCVAATRPLPGASLKGEEFGGLSKLADASHQVLDGPGMIAGARQFGIRHPIQTCVTVGS